jgi:hypothetical protein
MTDLLHSKSGEVLMRISLWSFGRLLYFTLFYFHWDPMCSVMSQLLCCIPYYPSCLVLRFRLLPSELELTVLKFVLIRFTFNV